MSALAVVLAAAAIGVAGLRWLRVAQREHYLPGSTTRFAQRWWILGPNAVLGFGVLVAVAGSFAAPLPAIVAAVGVAAGPFGLGIHGRTSALAWTRRLRTLAGVWLALELAVIGLGLALGNGPAGAAIAAAAVPLLVDAALAITAPIERRLAQRFVDQAAGKLRSVRPTVVAITGSYGKTSTKGYVAHLLEGSRTVSATPKSFNNRAGLARAINEHLPLGTDVFIAEMGTYGPGEIRDLCAWVPPDIAVITSIGPVHLERMGSEENIATAKAEITERASTVVLNVDSPHLARLADRLAATKKVLRVSAADLAADVAVVAEDGGLRVLRAGTDIARGLSVDAPPTNVACAVAVALELGVDPADVAARLPGLPTAEHRLTTITSGAGVTILDDTYNANPAGAARALDALAKVATPGRRTVLVTPGMVELGSRQADENARLAETAGRVVTDLIVVGQTNRAALLDGATRAGINTVTVDTRDAAVAWVRQHLSAGDAVLYENDLPDHFP